MGIKRKKERTPLRTKLFLFYFEVLSCLLTMCREFLIILFERTGCEGINFETKERSPSERLVFADSPHNEWEKKK